MRLLSTIAGLVMLGLGSAATACEVGQDIVVDDAYARAATPVAKAGGVYLSVTNNCDTAIQLVGAETPVAVRAELHTHVMVDGVMSMQEMAEPIVIEPGETFTFLRGGDHIMLMGLNMRFDDGAEVPLTLIFADGSKIDVTAIVDLER